MTLNELFENLHSKRTFITERDCEFIDSLKGQYSKRGFLSTSQEFHLTRLTEKYSNESIAESISFRKNYENYRLNAIRCAHYYRGQSVGYYAYIVEKVLNDESGHTLTKEEYRKICENKYAKKVIASYESPARFKSGDIVQIRKSNMIAKLNDTLSGRKHSDKLCLVTKVDAMHITRAAKGARVYEILVIGGASTILAHESDLKLPRSSKGGRK